MQEASASTRPPRNAKAIANVKLQTRVPPRKDTYQGAAIAVEQQIQEVSVLIHPAHLQPSLPQSSDMAGVATQTDPLQPEDIPITQDAQPGVTPGPLAPAQEMADMRAMIKSLMDRMDRADKPNTPPQSPTTGPRRRRSSSRDRRYSPTSERGSTRARRTSTGRRRSSSRRSSRRRSHSPRRRSRTRSSSRRRRRSSRSTSSRRSPNRIPITAQQTDVTAALAAQFPTIGSFKGKRLPVSALTLEPYRSLPPDLRKKAKERRSRRELSFPEHMCGLLKMIMSVMDPVTEAHAALSHAVHVAQDAATLPWPAVRDWTLACMGHIENGDASWHDAALFTNERTRLSWIKGRQMEADRHYPCPLYNKGACEHKLTHASEGTTWKHVCALCLYITGHEKTTHGAGTCRQRNQGRQHDDYRQDNRHKAQQGRQRKDKQDTASKN